MEKEEKGLFYRLMDFWKEKVSLGGTEMIGFPEERKERTIPLAEMGAVAALAQEETRLVFREESLPREKEEKKENSTVWAEKPVQRAERNMTEWLEEAVSETRTSEKEDDVFLVREEKRKNILLAAAEKEQKKELSEEAEETKTELPKREERQAEQAVDIEQLMQKITKKLWEERESSGRRLR